VKQDALLAATFPISEAPHYGGSRIDVVPAADIAGRDVR
jgi:hypothetical protein